MTPIALAHQRAVKAVQIATITASEEEAIELVDALAALVLEALAAFMPSTDGDETCN
jgi:hypothetical protein